MRVCAISPKNRFYPKRWAFDEQFGYNHTDFVIGETGYICDWSDVKGFLDLPKCVKGICGGHKEHDVLPFRVKVRR